MLAALINTFTAIASPIAAVVLNALWQGPLLVVAVWLLVRMWPQLNASTRYAIWCTTLAAVVIVPIATTLPFFTFAAATPATSATTTSSSPQTTAKALRVAGAPKVTHALTTRVEPATAKVHDSAAPPAALPPRFRVTFPLPLAIGVFALWAVLALMALVRLSIGLIRLEQLKRDALPLPVEYRDAMERWARANKGSREVRLCVSDETDVPVAVGLFDAMILIPRSLLEQLSAAEVDQISLHELAHLRRGDDWSNGFQRIALALLAWNPAALFVSQQLDLEREVACDDWVLSLTGTVRPYALCLTKMAETSGWPRQPIPAPGVFATRKHISLRIERLLGAGRNVATTLSLGPAAIAIAVVTTLSLAIAAVAPSVAAPCLQVLIPAGPVSAVVPPAKKIERIVVYSGTSPLPSMPALPAVPVVHVAAPKVHVPPNVRVAPIHVNVPKTDVRVPEVSVHVPEVNVHVPEVNVHAPEVNVRVPAVSVHIPAMPAIPSGLPMHRMLLAQSNVENCTSCDFSGVNWSGKDLRGRNYTGVDLSNANLQGADFSGSHLSGADFSHANLRGAKFRDAQLTGCDFGNADLIGTDFTGAKLSGCQFTGAQMTSSEVRAILNTCAGCDFSKANLSGVDLSHVRTSGIDFSDANLSGANLSGAEFVGDDFSGARLDGARLDGTTFSGCDLSGVDLSHVDLSKTKMIGTDFSVHRSPKP